jgi:hypothetical protein
MLKWLTGLNFWNKLLAQKPSLQSNKTDSFTTYSSVSEDKPGNEYYNYAAIYETCSFNT